jgi:hypothetical protein
MYDSRTKPRRLVWNWVKRLRDRLLDRFRAHVALALAADFRNLSMHVAAARQHGDELAASLAVRLATEMANKLATERAAVEERHQQDLERLEKLAADYECRLHDSNLFADGLAREIIRLQQQIDQLLEAVDGVADVMRHDVEPLPTTLKYRDAA